MSTLVVAEERPRRRRLPLLVDVDQDAAVDRVEEPDALDLARLEDDIAVGRMDGRTNAARCSSTSSEPGKSGSRKDSSSRNAETRGDGDPAGARPVALQRAQVVGVAELGAEVLEDGQ